MVNNVSKASAKTGKQSQKQVPRVEVSTLVAELIERGASKEELIGALEQIAKGIKPEKGEDVPKNVGNAETSGNIDLEGASRNRYESQVISTDDNPALLTLPHKEEFLLDMTNTNYSKETVYNYDRDLAVFEAFLNLTSMPFEQIDKKTVMQYKGFLQTGTYLQEMKKIGWERLFLNGKAPDSGRAGKGKSGALSSRSINRMLSSLRSFLRFLIDFDLEPRPIAPEAVKLVKLERKKSQVAELPDLIRLVECPSEYEKQKLVALRNRSILELLFSTGMRISELTKLDREQVDLSAVVENTATAVAGSSTNALAETGEKEPVKSVKESDDGTESKSTGESSLPTPGSGPKAQPNVQGKLFIMGKGKKQRFVYLTPRAQTHLLAYLKTRNDPYPALFIPYRGGRLGRRGQRLSVNYVQDKIAKYRRRLGIVVPTSAHSLRHGFATYMAEEGASPAAIQILLGHESLNTTDKYVHASDKFAADTHKKYHPLYEK